MKKKDRNFQQERGLYTGGWILLALAVLLRRGSTCPGRVFPAVFINGQGITVPAAAEPGQ